MMLGLEYHFFTTYSVVPQHHYWIYNVTDIETNVVKLKNVLRPFFSDLKT